MTCVQSVADAYSVFSSWSFETQEVVSAAFLNVELKVVGLREIFRGTVCRSIASPREILRAALLADAVFLIVAHNHPSNNPEPSQWDREFTKQMVAASALVGIPLLDHLIICRAGRYFSFAEAGSIRR